MKQFKFRRLSDEGVVLIDAVINERFLLRLALDTAATHTTIDSNALYFLGYSFTESTGKMQIETAGGIVLVETQEIRSIEALGISKNQFTVQVMDCLAQGIISDYDGMLGLYFLTEHQLCLTLATETIQISPLR